MNNDVFNYALRLGDDSLILGHRLSQWCSRAPFLEEDLALSNTALDYIGRARMYYGYAAKLADDGRNEDDFAFMRDQRAFSNLLIYELPRGDFAFTMVRQWFVDIYNSLFLAELCRSTDSGLSGIASKAIKETHYHLRRSREWMLRFGLGTEESKHRAQDGLDGIWGYTPELFEVDELERALIDRGIAVDCEALKTHWHQQVATTLAEAGLSKPDASWVVRGGREGYHTENLGQLLNEMQSVHRAYPGVKW